MIRGTHALTYCCEDISEIENYELAVNDAEHVWCCHHRAEILPCGRYTVAQLQKHGLYWNRPASELIFLRHDEHSRLHGYHPIEGMREAQRRAMLGRKNPNAIAAMRKATLGCVRSEETRRKISESKKGQRPWLGKHHSEETRMKISETMKRLGCGIGNKNAVGSKGHNGLKWITDGTSEKTIPLGAEPPMGWRFGRLRRAKKCSP